MKDSRVLLRYVTAAGLARTADGGAAVGLVLLAAEHGSQGFTGGVLAACLTAPHLLGPVLARRLDQARDGRRLIAACCVVYGAALALAAVTFSHVPLVLSLVLVAVAGLCGPILTGGLSSQLTGMIDDEETAQRRSQGWDATTYGVGGSAGPAAVAALSALTAPLVALLVLSAGAAAAAALMLTLPIARKSAAAAQLEALPFRTTIRIIGEWGGLRRVTAATMATALLGGAVAVFAVGLGLQMKMSADAGALLAALFGVGNLVGSILLTIVPLKGEPDRQTGWWAAAIGVAFLLGGFAPNLVWAMVAFTVAGLLNGPFFTATLAARTAYSPSAARAQVFVTMAALKIAAGTAGTAAAGVLGTRGARPGLALGGVFVVLVAAALAVDRRLSPPAQEEVVDDIEELTG